MAPDAKKKILIVEDESILAHMCGRVLELNGFFADIANNGLAAKEAINKKHYDLCITDIRLPGISGIQLYEQCKAAGNPIAEKMIFITGDTMNNSILDFLSKADKKCVMKPFHPSELVKIVKEMI